MYVFCIHWNEIYMWIGNKTDFDQDFHIFYIFNYKAKLKKLNSVSTEEKNLKNICLIKPFHLDKNIFFWCNVPCFCIKNVKNKIFKRFLKTANILFFFFWDSYLCLNHLLFETFANGKRNICEISSVLKIVKKC